MKDRLTLLIGGMLALALVYVMLVPKPAPQAPFSRPTSVDTGANGLFALDRWLAESGLATHSLRRRYDALLDPEEIPSDVGNILVISMPHKNRPRFDELEDLLEWVRYGNTLVILAALQDNARWSASGDFVYFFDDLRSITGADAAAGEDPDAVARRFASSLADLARRPLTASPVFPHPLLAGVESLHGVTALGRSDQHVHMDLDYPLFALAADDETGLTMLWEQREGSGRIILSSYSSLLANRALGKGDNRQFVNNLIRRHLDPDGRFIFDDMHQGLSTLYDPDAFFSDSRLHNSIYFLIGFWLIYLLGATNRIGEARVVRRDANEADFVDATGRFIARRVRPGVVAASMFRNFFDEIRRRHHYAENGEPAWDLLLRSPLVPDALVGKLRERFQALEAGRKVDLVKLQNQLNEIRRSLS